MDNIFSVSPFGARVDTAKHLVEHDQRRVREDRFHLAGEHDQSRRSARRVESRKMLSACHPLLVKFLGRADLLILDDVGFASTLAPATTCSKSSDGDLVDRARG